ncbi:MAG: asparagine synthase-related protein [Sphingomonadales bacterium]|nr:asparagine synthase-related protein [Sphingomonadales bacterium]
MTMYRYIALVWNRTDREAAKAARFIAAKLNEVSPHQWRQAWDGAGLAIYDAGAERGRMQTYRLHRDGGAVLGRLFRNDYTSQIADLDETESRKCLETRGQHLIDNYWGRYVAFLHDAASGTKYIMRDPTGAFPCFSTPYRGVEIYFSDMQDAANFDFLPFTVNWEYLKTNIMFPMYQKTHTGLNEVGEVLPAECLEIGPFERKSRFVWDPTEISQTDVVEDPEEAAALLRATVKSTIGALAGCYDRVVHNLGGLDSSIVLACMAQAPKRPEITCINYFTKSPGGEERFYSRQAADKFGVPFIELELDYRKADLTKLFHSNKLARPPGYFDCVGLINDVLGIAKEKQAQALFYGVGGDNVFFQPALSLGALDYVHARGFGRDTLRVGMEAARYGRKSLFKILRGMAKERFIPAPCYRYVRDELFKDYKIPFINLDFAGTDGHEKFLHPLLIPNDGMAKGKFVHIFCCALFSIEYYDHWDMNYFAERVHAYLTQPIIEACLRIPIWVLTHGGIDRGLARKAFQHDLPRDIVIRHTKSTPGPYYRDIYDHNIDLLREWLLEGVIVEEKVLLRDRVEQALSKKGLFLETSPQQMLGYFATEVWLRGWIDRPMKQVKSKEMAV